MRINGPNVARLKLPAEQSELIVFDDDLPRFGVRLRAGGKRTWVVQYRLGKKQRRVTLGNVGAVDADDARKLARTALAKADLGDDPQSEKSTKRAKAEHTLEVIADRYLIHAKGRLRERTYEEVERHLTKHWALLKEIPAYQIDRRDVSARLTDIAQTNGPIAANRARAWLSAMFAWAMREGLVDLNPVVGTNKAGEEQSRDRVLSNNELLEIWNACDRDDDYCRIVRLLLLTGQRREEVGGMGEDELDIPKRLWTIPGDRTKNGRSHEVPLSDAVLDIIERIERREGRALLFGQGDGAFSGWSNAKGALDKRMVEVLTKKVGKQKAKLVPWRLHDIRRTVATRMAESPDDGGLGILPHIVEAMLGHVSGFRSGVAGVYNYAAYRAEKRQALDRWAEHLRSTVNGQNTNVVSLRVAAS